MQVKPKYFKIRDIRGNKTNSGIVYYMLEYDARPFRNALCTSIGPDIYFPLNTTIAAEERMAVKACLNCTAREACLEWALVHERNGIWGGMTAPQRRKERRRRKWGLTEPRTTLAVVARANP